MAAIRKKINIIYTIMRKNILLLFVFVTFILNAQETLSKEEIKQKTDSILVEGNLLYQYEKAAWVSTDQALALKDIKKKFGGYLIYQSGDSIKAIILEKSQDSCIYEMTYLKDFSIPCKENLISRGLNDLEKKLQSIKKKLFKEVFTSKYQISCPEGYNLNMELIPYELGYKLYIIAGTSKSEVIPFGNDYIFFADKNGEITSWRKFHSRLISMMTKYNGETVRSISHSHLRVEPFISATDICTFKLYGSLYGLKQFEVYSPALSTSFTYDIVKNTIESGDK